ncbi:sulfatase family protein [Agromyces cerinus]|uniref:Arylsulfatase A n=1 Tax=Agromyces cerinus subsp. cerinus TaxID=232089 RepID=A0A1N6F016_9MICO|nr:sulfatase [Agromyces cerinus]SIN88612.1 Arylsulfatase A [Agromyces cerinus subsp. cerinus]
MSSQRNIVVVMADQFRAEAIAALGTDPVVTPNLDRLVAEGCAVQHSVSSYPVCSPHRAMFLTGMTPSHNGVTLNVNSETAADGVGLRDGVETWASVLADRGYRTGYIGKWHLEPPVAADELHGEGRRDDGKVWDAWSPPGRRFGFEFWHAYGAADRHLAPHYWVGDAERHERLDVDRWSAAHEVDVAIDFVADAAARAEPFALMVSLNPPHQPFEEVPARYRRNFEQVSDDQLLTRPNVPFGTPVAREAGRVARDYFAAITGVDEQIGRLVAALDSIASASDTIVAFTSDHGMQLGSHGLMYKNVPYEESMRIPLVLRCPGFVPPGRSEEMVSSLDFAPTILGLVGSASARPEGMVGSDRSDSLTGRAPVSEDPAAVYYRFASRSDTTELRGLRTRSRKLIGTWHPELGLTIECFDLVADPFEQDGEAFDPTAAGLAVRLLRRLEHDGDDWPGLEPLRERVCAVV